MNAEERRRTRFELTLTGDDWWKPFLGLWASLLALCLPVLLATRVAPAILARVDLFLLLVLVWVTGMLLVQAVFTIASLRIAVPKLSLGERAFDFRGKVGAYLGLNAAGALLSFLTLTVYVAWYVRRVVAYLVGSTSLDGARAEFLGKGRRLFGYLAIGLWIPVLVVFIFALVILVAAIDRGSTMPLDAGSAVYLAAVVGLVVAIPSFYLVCSWCVSFRWNDVAVALKTTFWTSCRYILGRLLLTVLTLGVYWPVAALELYGYFLSRTVLSRDGVEVGRLGFDGRLGSGFGLLWGQTLLAVVTLGVYAPWAAANIGRWIAAGTYVERGARSG